MTNYEENSKKIFELVNQLRTEPQSFVATLEEMLPRFSKNYYKVPGTNINIITSEGAEAVQEAIDFLKEQQPIEELTYSKGLSQAGLDHCKDIGKRGVASHEGVDGSRMCDRVDKYGEWSISIAENICFDDSKPMDIVLGQIIDDGNSNRGHRTNVFNQEFKFLGVGSAKHKNFRHCCVLNFAVEYLDDEEKYQSEIQNHDQETQVIVEAPERKVQFSENKSPQPILNNVQLIEGAVSVKVKKSSKTIGNVKTTVVKRIFTMQDGSTVVEESEDEEYIQQFIL